MKTMFKTLISGALVAGTMVAAPAMAATVGNPAVNRGFVDSSSSLTYILDQSFGATPGQLTSFNFFAGRAGDVTPLIFSRADTGGAITFTLLGIGTTRNVGTGAYTFDFGLMQGSALTDAASYFGFRTVNLGVVSYGYQSSALPGTFATVASNSGVGTTFSFDPNSRASDNGNGLNFRGYSINATTGAVPEPATWAMMILGMGAVGFTMRSAKRRSEKKFDAKIEAITAGALA